MIKGVIFDCFGVLCHGSLDYLRSITPPERLTELNDLSHASNYGYISESEYSEKVSEIIGRPANEIAELTKKQRVLSKEMLQFVRSLRPRYKTAMLSNVGRGVVDELFSPQEQAELFDVVVLSSEIGMLKPNPEIYELAAERLGLSVEECVMVDDLRTNVDGAVNAGMRGVMCENFAQCAAEVEKILEPENARTA